LSQIGSTECFSLELKYNGVGVANGIFWTMFQLLLIKFYPPHVLWHQRSTCLFWFSLLLWFLWWTFLWIHWTTVNIILFFYVQKNGAESLLESKMKAKYDFLKIFMSIFHALKWVFVSPKGRKSTIHRDSTV
jgi:hypothetical protein